MLLIKKRQQISKNLKSTHKKKLKAKKKTSKFGNKLNNAKNLKWNVLNGNHVAMAFDSY